MQHEVVIFSESFCKHYRKYRYIDIIDVTYRGVRMCYLHMCKKLCKGFCIDFKPFFKLSIMSLMMSQESNAKSLQEQKAFQLTLVLL